MTATAAQSPADLIDVKIDGKTVSVPKGTLIIRAAEQAGIRIPRFCDHPLLKPVAACRQCLVQVAMPGRDGVVRPMPKPQPSCAMTVVPGMEVETQFTNEVAAKAQKGVLEFLLINHPLDCPICDKAGECPLQNQVMSDGNTSSRFTDEKRTFPKPIHLTSQVLLDRDRCVLCQRCTRFAAQIPGDRFIALQGRGGGHAGLEIGELNGSQIGTYDANVLNFATDTPVVEDELQSDPFGNASYDAGYASGEVHPANQDQSGRPFSSYFGGNLVQICPVGALTSQAYRFRARPFDLVSVPSITEHDSSGSAVRVDVRRGVVLRRQAGEDSAVNEEWITDKDRFAFSWQTAPNRLHRPQARLAHLEHLRQGDLTTASDKSEQRAEISWAQAFAAVASVLKGKRVGFLPGGRLPLEDAYAWSKFARVVSHTNDIDFRVRASNCAEQRVLGSVAGTGLGVTYQQLENAGQVLFVGFEPEEEVGSVFLRLHKGVQAGKVKVATVSSWLSNGNKKLQARLLETAPGSEAETLAEIRPDGKYADLFAALQEGGIILVGERAANTKSLYGALMQLVRDSGAKWQWIPRRSGERAALEMGALPALLPYGRPVSDDAARAEVEKLWGQLPAQPGLNLKKMLKAASSGELDVLIVGGVDLEDLPYQQLAKKAFATVPMLISLEVLPNQITDLADIVLPVAPPQEKAGTYVNWEGRLRPFGQVLVSTALPDREVFAGIASEMGIDLGVAKVADVHNELRALGAYRGTRLALPGVISGTQSSNLLEKSGGCGCSCGDKEPFGPVKVDTWRLLLDDGICQQGDSALADTARVAVARMSSETAKTYGLEDNGQVVVTGPAGSLTLPVAITPMPANVVWLAQKSRGCHVYRDLGVSAGQTVRLAPAATEVN